MKIKNAHLRNSLLIILVACTNTLFSSGIKSNNKFNNQAVKELIERIIPGKSDSFIIEAIPSENNQEVFELEGVNGKIVLRGSSTLAITRAFNWYLNHFCHTSVSWFKEEPVDLPSVLPNVTERIKKTSRFEKRFF